MSERCTMRVAVFVLLEKKGQIFCIRRANTGFADGQYTLPSGHVEKGEKPLEAAVREAREEAGVIVTQEQLYHVHTGYTSRPELPYINLYFLARQWTLEPYNAEPHLCDDAGWYAYDALPEPLIPYVRHTIQKIQQGDTYSDFEIDPDTL